jgi:ATP-dependent Zn protease
MKDVFEQADVEVTKENRKDIDRAIHNIVGVEYKNCSATWKAVKEKLAENKDNFIQELKTTLS